MSDTAPGQSLAADLALHLSAIVESSHDAIIANDAGGRITSWNAGAARLYGYSAEEAIGQPISIIEPPGNARETSLILTRVLSGERVEHYETRRIAKDGRRVDVSLSVSPIHDPDGAIVGAAEIARDISERRRAEQYRSTLLELTAVLASANTIEQAAPRLLEQICRNLSADIGALWLFDNVGKALELTSRWRDPAIPPERAGAAEPTVERLARGEGLPGEAWLTGEPVWVADVRSVKDFPRSQVITGDDVRGAIALPVWSGKHVLGVLEFFSHDLREPDATVTDLLRAIGAQVGGFVQRARTTQRLSEATAEAVRANQSKSEFLSRMSHELRTPLNGILGFAQLLELDDLTRSQREAVAQMLKAGRHLLALIDEVLDIARIEAEELRLSIEPVVAAEVIEESIALLAPLAERRGIRIDTALGARPACALADRQRVKQVLLNLLSNAVKYNREAGLVRIRLESRAGARVAILVDDSGPGISPEHQAHLFEPFERFGAEGSNVEGTGLGLSLSKRLVEAMGGTLEVSSRLGRGTTMTLELPCAEPHEDVAQQAQAPAPPALPARTLLYIEHNLANLKLVERALQQLGGVRMLPAMQGRLGLELAREHHPDLVLLDLHMPDLSGREVLLRLKAEPALRETPVIVVSADATERQQKAMLSAGARGYVAKPIDIPGFLKLITECIDEVRE